MRNILVRFKMNSTIINLVQTNYLNLICVSSKFLNIFSKTNIFITKAKQYVNKNRDYYNILYLETIFLHIENDILNTRIVDIVSTIYPNVLTDSVNLMSKQFFDCIYERGYGSSIEYMCITCRIYTESVLFEKNTFQERFLDHMLWNYEEDCGVSDEENFDTFKDLISSYIDHYKNELIATESYYIIFRHDLCCVKLLLSKIDVDLYKGLKEAIQDANFDVVKYLLEELKVEIRDEIFYMAVKSRSSKSLCIVKYLYERYKFKITNELFELSITDDNYFIKFDILEFFLEQEFNPKDVKDKILTKLFYNPHFCPLQIVTIDAIYDFRVKDNFNNDIYILCPNNSKRIFKFLIEDCKAILIR